MMMVRDETEVAFADLNMMHLQDIVETICSHALDRAYLPTARVKIKRSNEERPFQDMLFLKRLRVGLMQGAAYLLASSDDRVLSVYLIEETTQSTSPAEIDPATIAKTNLLILVRSRSAALNALAEALDQALVREVAKLPESALIDHDSLLNPIFITEADVVQHKGYAMLLSSALAPPLIIWQRDEAECPV